MKKITIIFLMLFASMSFAQNQPIDFEPGGFGADWTWTVFENETNPPLEIIDNPDPNGANTSATVAKFTALDAGNPWAGVESQQGVDLGTFEWNDDNRIVKIMVWKSVISDVGIKFATETGWAEPELKVSNTLTNQWEELTFDFSNAINPPDPENGTLGQIIIFPDFQDRDQDNVVYFDNITFGTGGEDPPPADGPEVAAPNPPALDPGQVISIFSDAYANVDGTDFNPSWGQSTQVSFIEINGNETMKYASFNYQGVEFASALNVTDMEYLHVDMWTADATTVNIFCISSGPNEVAYSLPVTPNTWVSYDIPLSAFAGVDLADLIQFKFDGGDGTPTLYFDNIYFYTEEMEEGTDATLSDLQVDGTTVEGFSPSILNYSVVLPEGTSEVPPVTATPNDPEANAVVTPADALPGTTSILVTSANTEVELTYTVAFSVETDDVAGPRNPIDFEPDGYGADWTWTVFENETNPPLEIIDNPDASGMNTSATVAQFTALAAGNPWAGVESQHGVDLGTFEWNEDNRIVKIMVWKSVISDVGIKFATETGWAEEELKVSNTLTNEWEELTFDFSNAINPPNPENGTLGQIIIFPDFQERDQDNVIYFDNITFGTGGDDPPPADGPEVAAPVPPARDPENVISLFSNAYTDVPVDTWRTDWSVADYEEVEIDGNPTKKYTNLDYVGIETVANQIDITNMTHFHLDVWSPNFTLFRVKLVDFGPDGAWNGGDDTEHEVVFDEVAQGEWVSLDIPLDVFTELENRENIAQLVLSAQPAGATTVYVDNMYFFKEPPTSVETIEQNEVSLYPNPASVGGQVHLSNVADQIHVYDLTGKLVISLSKASTINIADLPAGFFTVRILDADGNTQVKKLIVR